MSRARGEARARPRIRVDLLPPGALDRSGGTDWRDAADYIDKATKEIKQDEDKVVYESLEEIGEDLPDHSPRFVLLSYPLTLVRTPLTTLSVPKHIHALCIFRGTLSIYRSPLALCTTPKHASFRIPLHVPLETSDRTWRRSHGNTQTAHAVPYHSG